MKTIGIVGGVAWPSSIVYYRVINELIAERMGDGGLHCARLVLAQTDFAEIQRRQREGRWDIVGDLLAEQGNKLKAAGADFFLLACNLLGLLPWSATPTSNIAVTGAMAFVSLAVIEISGIRALGLKGYLGTIFFLPHGLPALLKPVMLVIMTPIEIIGKLAKPFALAVRLFANMTAGHVVVLALIGLTFFFRSYLVGVAASLMATGIMLLELFVAFLQAFVFTLLTSVFIGLMRTEHE